MKQKILMLWAIARSRSTAFEVMMRQRGDFTVLHEPFGMAYYCGEDRLSHRLTEVPPQSEYNYQVVWQRLRHQAECDRMFVKELPNHVLPLLDAALISHFHNTFLIRHPAKSLPSHFDKIQDLTLEEAGFVDLYRIFELAREVTGRVPVVIDAEDLVQHPKATIQAYCEAVGIAFMPEALSWEPGPRPEISYWDHGNWHVFLKSSRGFQDRPRRDYIDVHDNPHLYHIYKQSLPYYHKIYAHHLRISP